MKPSNQLAIAVVLNPAVKLEDVRGFMIFCLLLHASTHCKRSFLLQKLKSLCDVQPFHPFSQPRPLKEFI